MAHRSRLCFARIPIFRSFVFLALFAGLSAGLDATGLGGSVASDSLIVDRVDQVRLERVVRALSGADTIYVDGEPVTIATRYALSEQIDLARSYLLDEVRSAGYEPLVQPFVLSITRPQLEATAASRTADTLWVAGTSGVVYRSCRTFAASDWSPFERCGAIAGKVFDLEVDPSGRLWAACGYEGSPDGGLHVSTDGGSSWTRRASGGSIQALGTVTLRDAQTGMASGANGTVISTTNGGRSWRQIPPDVVGYESLYRSATNGPMHYWFISDVGSLWETTDLGVWWTRRLPVWTPIAGIDFFGASCGIIVGDGVVYYTKDGGQDWNPVSIPTALREVAMVDTARAIASSAGGEIWLTEDGGMSWSRFGSECDVSADVQSVAYAGDGWFSLTGGSLARRIHWEDALRSCAAYQFADTLWGRNISFRHEGLSDPTTHVFLTAHYDSYSGTAPRCAPGADDNASGVAAVLECARALRGERTERSIDFVLFDAEEEGLKGSRYYASVLPSGETYEGVLNLDMIGCNLGGAMSAVVSMRVGTAGDSIIAAGMAAALDSFAPGLTVEYINYSLSGSSDQLSFWEYGIPGVLLIEGRRDQLNPNYHTCTDVADALDFGYLGACTKTALGTVAILAGLLPPEEAPKPFALYQNYPNPFSAETAISYALPSPSFVELEVFDVSGRRVAVVERGPREKGPVTRMWDGTDARGKPLASGVYFLRLSSERGLAVRKIVISR